MIVRLLSTIGMIAGGVWLGMILRNRLTPVVGDARVTVLRRRLQMAVLLVLNPIAFFGAVWIVPLESATIIAMPFVALFALLLGAALGNVLGRVQRLSRRERGVHVMAGWFTNIGAIGSLVCFILLGEVAFAFVPVYKLFEEISYYAFAFPLARRFSDENGESRTLARRVAATMRDPFVLVAATAISVGIALNLAGVERPAFFGLLNAVLVPLLSIMLLVSIGMGLRVRRASRRFRTALPIIAIKHLIVPAVTTLLAWTLGFGAVADGTPLKVVLILSSMPAGTLTVVVISLYRLDEDLSNADWLLSNVAFLAVIPVLAALLPYF